MQRCARAPRACVLLLGRHVGVDLLGGLAHADDQQAGRQRVQRARVAHLPACGRMRSLTTVRTGRRSAFSAQHMAKLLHEGTLRTSINDKQLLSRLPFARELLCACLHGYLRSEEVAETCGAHHTHGNS